MNGEEFRQWRHRMRWTQAYAATMLGKKRQADISNMECGIVAVSGAVAVLCWLYEDRAILRRVQGHLGLPVTPWRAPGSGSRPLSTASRGGSPACALESL